MITRYVYSNNDMIEMAKFDAKYYVVHIIDNMIGFVECVSTDTELLEVLKYADLTETTMFDETENLEDQKYSSRRIVNFCKRSGIVSLVDDRGEKQKVVLKIFVSNSLHSGMDEFFLPFKYEEASAGDSPLDLSNKWGVDFARLLATFHNPNIQKCDGVIVDMDDFVVDATGYFSTRSNKDEKLIFTKYESPGEPVKDYEGKIIYDAGGKVCREASKYYWDATMTSATSDNDPVYSFDEIPTIDDLIKSLEYAVESE